MAKGDRARKSSRFTAPLSSKVVSFEDKMRTQMTEGFEEMKGLLEEFTARREELQAKEDNWNVLEKRISDNIAKMDTTVKLNIRGKLFETMKDNLVRQPGSYFHTLLGSGHWQPAKDGSYKVFVR
jgi:hypothetical protein